MKKNWLQILTLCLCVVLLAITVVQGKRLEEYRDWMDYRLQEVEQSLESQLYQVEFNLKQSLEEAEKNVADYTVEAVGIDRENRALLADVSVTLKEWYEDTEVILLARTGAAEASHSLDASGNGVYAGTVSVPLEGEFELDLEVQILGGGRMEQESLSAWVDGSEIFPLWSYGGGGYSAQEYYDGALHSDFYINLESRDGGVLTTANAEFLVYRNGELVQTLPALYSPSLSIDSTTSFKVPAGPEGWSVECAEDDAIVIRFRCLDEFGLGYDFPFIDWTPAGEISNQPGVMIFWPE